MLKSRAMEFAYDELKDGSIYRNLAKGEKNPRIKAVLQKLSADEDRHFRFWLKFCRGEEIRVSGVQLFFYNVMRKIFGVTFTLKFLEKHEDDVVKGYKDVLPLLKNRDAAELRKIIRDEETHEKELMKSIKEERVKYLGAAILGLNDALVELTGAIFGLSAVFAAVLTVGVAGLVTGVAASLSMSASSYLSAKAELGGADAKKPSKAAVYTGSFYIITTLLLVAPFFFLGSKIAALATSLCVGILIIIFFSFYTSVLLDKKLSRELAEMLLLSLGIAAFTFVFGTAVKALFGLGAL